MSYLNCPLDGAVLSGTLVWKSAPAVSRTAAQFTFTLTLSLEHTPTNATAGDEVRWPGSLKFGDGNEVEGGAMKVSTSDLQLCLQCRGEVKSLIMCFFNFPLLYMTTHADPLHQSFRRLSGCNSLPPPPLSHCQSLWQPLVGKV